jgi:sec-independent protein translocase protein TatB
LFELGFVKLLVIAVVALVVVGPERLPTVARNVGKWMAKMRRYVDDVKADFNRQGELAELRKFKEEVTSAATSFKDEMQSNMSEATAGIQSMNQAITNTIAGDPSPDTSSDSALTDWDQVWALRRTREKIKERRKDRIKELGLSRSKYRR